MPLTHYQVLGLTAAATADDVRRAYKREALEWHPDRRKDDPKAHRRFIAIRAAYDVLRDPARRAQYDLVLQQRAAARQAPPRPENPWNRAPYGAPYQQPYGPPPRRPGPAPRPEPQKRGIPTGLVVVLLIWLLRFLATESCESRHATLMDPARPNGIARFDTASSFLKSVAAADSALAGAVSRVGDRPE